MLLTKRQQKIVIYVEKLAQNLWAYWWDVLTLWIASLETHSQSRLRPPTVGQLFDLFSFLWIFKYSQSSDKVAKFIWIRQGLFMRTRKNQRVNPRSASTFQDRRWASDDAIISTIISLFRLWNCFFFISNMFHILGRSACWTTEQNEIVPPFSFILWFNSRVCEIFYTKG